MTRAEWLAEFNGLVDACETWRSVWQRYVASLPPEHRHDGEWEKDRSWHGHQAAREALLQFVTEIPLPDEEE